MSVFLLEKYAKFKKFYSRKTVKNLHALKRASTKQPSPTLTKYNNRCYTISTVLGNLALKVHLCVLIRIIITHLKYSFITVCHKRCDVTV